MNKCGNQTIECEVHSCRFNSNSRHCDLDSIMVSPVRHATPNMPHDSMCASYKEK